MLKIKVIFLALLVIVESATFCYAADIKAVGVVSLIIGNVYVTRSQNGKNVLKKGSHIFSGDRIETNQRSHVHIKFIDDARISIRPNSRLDVDAYSYNGTYPEKSSIRFFLHQGVLRSISGKATETDHSRYRMNTPIAALGVLGTDYVVRANTEETLAAVFSGGITLSPFNATCRSHSLGSCQNATILMANMTGKYLEVKKGGTNKQLKIQIKEIKKDLNIKTEIEGTVEDNSQIPKIEGAAGTNSQASKIEENIDIEQSGNNIAPLKIIMHEAIDNEKAEVLPETILKPQLSSLFWVRWPWQIQHINDALSQKENAEKSNNEITIGNQYAGLFRKKTDALEIIPTVGQYQFQLQNSFVVFSPIDKSWSESTAATIENSSLQIDFAKRTFNTQLELSHPQVSNTLLEASGLIQKNGIYRGNGLNSKVSGAITLEGDAAGMQFEKQVEHGVFQGMSVWTR